MDERTYGSNAPTKAMEDEFNSILAYNGLSPVAPLLPDDDLGSLSLMFAREISATGRTVRLCTDLARNEYGDAAPWPSEPPPVPFSVYPCSRGEFATLAIDLDGKLGDAESDAASIAARMRDVGVEPLVCASGSPGARHVFVTLDPPMPDRLVRPLRDFLLAEFASIDPACLLPDSTIRPPLAPHRHGGRSQPLIPTDQALTVLRSKTGYSGFRGLLVAFGMDPAEASLRVPTGRTLDQAFRALSPTYQRMLRTGEKARLDTTRSGVEYSIMLSAAHAGLELYDLQRLLLLPGNAGGERYRERYDQDRTSARRELARQWSKVGDQVGAPVPLDDLDAFHDLVSEREFYGQSGGTDLAVLRAMESIAREARSSTPSASLRQIAEKAQAHHPTISRSVGRLAEGGFFVYQPAPSKQLASSFILNCHDRTTITYPIKEETVQDRTTITPGGGIVDSGTNLKSHNNKNTAHDVWMPSALGRTCRAIYESLDDEPKSVAQIKAIVSKSEPTIGRHLKTLRGHELAVKLNEGHIRGHQDLDQVAKAIGATGLLAALENKHAFERDAFTDWRLSRTRKKWVSNEPSASDPDEPLPEWTGPEPQDIEFVSEEPPQWTDFESSESAAGIMGATPWGKPKQT